MKDELDDLIETENYLNDDGISEREPLPVCSNSLLEKLRQEARFHDNAANEEEMAGNIAKREWHKGAATGLRQACGMTTELSNAPMSLQGSERI